MTKLAMEDLSDPIWRCILHAAGEADLMSKESLEKIRKDGAVDVTLTVNGFELPAEKWFDNISKQFEQMLTKHALALLEEKFGGKVADFSELIDEARFEFQQKAGEILGMEYDHDTRTWDEPE